MSRNLLEILADEAMKGNKPSNTFRAFLFTRVAREISEKFGIDCQPKHVDNHLRTVKTTWSIIVKIRAKSGFGWDEKLKMITCAKDTYVQEVQMYDKMAIVVGKDVATGGFGRLHIDVQAKNNPVLEEPVEVDMEGEDKSSEKQMYSNSTTSKSRSNRKRDRVNSELEGKHTMIAEKMDNITKSIAKMDVFLMLMIFMMS
ncbi:hypothetical protein CJ030_MR2G020056 [Morella rubra]|uniref:Myb/SANT-like domain-containing protein n=1 Tax=Morella rubra TaxID=262757 RepID=A0A6A1WF71_9ROSI|nr:hypothetical protein CJ030_MR2G020056 [Morella rubra]